MRRQLAILFATLLITVPLTDRPAVAQTGATTQVGSPVSAGQRVEIVGRRTRTSRTYLEHGRELVTIYPGSINYQDATGAWQLIDDALGPATRSGYAYQDKANRYTASFPSDLGKAPIRFETKDGWVEFSLAGGSGPGSVSGSTDTFSLPSGSVSYTAGNDELKENLTLSSPSSPSTFVYSLRTGPGVTARQSAEGGIDFADGAGHSLFSFLPPSMEDSSHSPAGRSHAASRCSRQPPGRPSPSRRIAPGS